MESQESISKILRKRCDSLKQYSSVYQKPDYVAGDIIVYIYDVDDWASFLPERLINTRSLYLVNDVIEDESKPSSRMVSAQPIFRRVRLTRRSNLFSGNYMKVTEAFIGTKYMAAIHSQEFGL